MVKKQSFTTKDLSITALLTAIMCILAPLSIPLPFSPVPLSFTTLILYISGYIAGWKKSLASYLLYLCIGLAGIPVFSGFSGGFGKLAGPTGGYLLGMIFLAAIASYAIEKFPHHYFIQLLGMIAGTALLYFIGTYWLALQTNSTFYQALFIGVVPFLIGDAVKIVAALLVGPILRRTLFLSQTAS
ncbi:MAG: biotin transporter BioY [Epulopiscium sp.]|jgi:biotin transport system substrate-specific component|nr:biotin transporter BioY [Candidatus Epulonipiscium sp.]